MSFDPTAFLQHLGTLTGQGLLIFFFKAFAILLSFLYLIYTIIAHRQTRLMLRTLNGQRHAFFLLVSTVQIIVALGLLLLAFVLV